MEAILLHAPPAIFSSIWSTYFQGKIGKLATHPFANFVVAKAVLRLDEGGIEEVVRECKSLSGGRSLISRLLIGWSTRAAG